MSQFILKGEALVQKIKQKTGLSDYKKELRDEIQSFYDNFIIPYQTDQNSNTQIGQQNYESIMKQLYQEYIQILKYTQMTFNDNEIQQMRYFVLDKIVEDSKKPVQPINTELIDSLNNIIQDDNNKNSFLGIKALFQIIKCQSDKLNQGLNQRHEVSPLMFFSMGNLDLIYCIINQFMNQKMLNFQNLKNLFQQQKDKQQYSNYLKDQTIQKQINLQQQNEMPLIENKYDLRIYEEMTATVTVTMIFLGGAQKIDSIQKQGDILQKIKQIIETSKNYLKAGVNAIFNTNFEFTQSEFNRKFHEDLGNVHRKMILYIQEVYTIIQQQIDQNANSSIYISDLLRVTSSYVSKFPDEYIDIKIQLYKIYQKVLFAQQNFNDNDLNKYALNYNEVFMMDRLVSNYSKIEILTLYLKIIQIIFTIEPNQQNQNGQLIRIHQTSKISQLNDQKVQEMVKMVIEILISTIYDNSINLDIQMRIVDILYSLINKYITQDNEYFKRQINHDQLINKIKYLEEILKFISSKYKDLNFVLISIQNFLKKQFIKSQQQSKQPIAQHNQQVHLPVQTPHSNIQNITQPVQQQRLQQPPNQPQGVTQQIQIRPAQPRVMPNGPLNTQAVLQKKNMQQQQNTSVEDELSLQKKYIEWIQKKKNQVSISTFPKMQRVKKDDSSELEKIQQEILENEDYYTFQVENLTKLNAREDIQGEFEGEFLQFHGIEIKRENLQYYFAQLTYFIRAFIHFQYKIQQILYSKNTEYKKQFQPNELSNAFKQYNLNQTQLNILRKIFKNGIELLTNYHQMYHVEAKFIEQSVVKSFIKIFAVIEHECHFKDIIEPNFKLILKLLIKTYQDNDKSQCQCSRQILETAFQESSNTQPSNPPNYFPTASFFNHILLKNFFLLIEQSNETLDPFNEFYGLYKNKFFETIQHLMKSVFTGIIVQYDNDQYKQIIKKSILFLFKKIHTSPYPLEYLKLLKQFISQTNFSICNYFFTLFRWFAYELSEQIMKNSNKESQIKPEINSICKSSDKMIEDKQVDYLNQETTSLEKQLSENKELTEDKKAQIKERLKQLKDECRNFEGINILDNITQLLELNSSKFQAQIVKISLCLPNLYSQNLDLQRKKQAAKILLICTTINERNFATQALNQLDNMISKLSREELEVTLEDIKEELIDRLFQIASENRPIDFTLKNEELEKLVKQSRQNQQPNINQRLTDNSKIAFRLLSKLQFLTKQHKIHTFIFENESAPEVQEKIYLEFDILQNNTNEKPKKSIFKLDIKQSVEHAICLFNRIINNFSNQPMKSNVIDVSFALIKFCVVKYFCRCDNLDIKWLYENENGARLQEQHAQKSQQGQQQQGKQIEEVIQEEFEVKKKILREFNFEQHQQEEAEQCLDSKFDCLFGTSSSPSQNSSNLLIMKLLKVLMDLTSIDQKIERDQGLLLKIRKESERILTIISKVISQNIIDLTLFQLGQNQITNQFYFKNMFANMNSPQHVFIATIVKSLKNSNFMERRNNLKTQTCSEKQFLWNELLIKNIYKNLQTDGTKHIIQQAQQQHPNSTQMVLEPSPKMANYESEQAKQVVDLMIGELENFVINMLTKEIGNSNDSFSQTSNSRQLFFPSCDTSQQLSTNQVMGSSIISSHNFESPSDSRMFDNNNNSLNKRYCLVECLNEVMNIFKPKIIGKHIQNILDCAYIISNNLPEVVNLQSMQDFCQLLIKKILQYIKKQKEQYNLNSPQLRKVLQTFVNNLTTCKPISHLYSRNALNSIAKIHNTNVISILYLSQNGNTNEDVKFCDTFDQLIAQAKKDDDLADNLASIQQLEQMPSKYDYATLVKNHRNLYITDLLIQIYTAISMFQQEYGTSGNLYYTQNSQINRKLLCIFNCYKSLEYLLACENCLPFKLISIQRIQETPQDLNQSNQQPKLLFTFKFDDSFLKMIFTSQKILEKNNKEMKTSRIILSNTQEGTPQNMMPPHVNQPMPVPPNNQPAQSLQDLNQPMNKVIPGRGSVGENMFPGGPNTPNPRNQNGLMMQPHPNPLPNHPPNMNPNNQNGRLINQYPNNPQALTQPNQPYPANAPPARPNNQYQANPNMPPPNPNNPNYPPPVPGYQYNMNNQPNRPMPPNINMNNMVKRRIIQFIYFCLIKNFFLYLIKQQRPINPPPASGQAPAQTKNQNSFINQCQLFYEDELGLNIEDLNFNIKNWAKLLSSIILILKQINLSIPTKYFNSLIDKEEKKIIEQTNPNYVRIPAELRAKTFEKIEEINYQNLNKLYEMMPRIEKTIHSTVQESIIEINKKNGNNNKVALEEEKLKVILRPLLVCLQSPFHRFTPQFLLIFKKLLKMLINCFNGRLIVLLLQKLDDIIKDTSNIQNEQSFSNYKIKNVSGVLTMFQHLKNPFYQQKGSREAVSSKEQIKQIINSTIEIQKNYSTRYGWHYVEQKTLIPISKLLNVQTEFVTEILMKDKKMVQNSQQQNDPLNSLTDQALEFIYKVIKMDKSFELRESLTREYQDQDFLIRFWDPQRNLQLQLKIIYLLAKKSSRVFKQQKIDGIKFLIEENKKSPNTNLMNYKNYMLFMKLFILYFQRKRDTNIFNCITSIYNERYPCPHFIKRFFEEQVPGLLTLEQKKRLLLSTLTNMYSNMDVPQIRVMLKLIIKPIVKSLTKEQIIQMNIQPLNQQGRPGQLMIHFFFDAQKKFEERFKKFQSDVQNIPHLQQQIQSIQQQQQQGFQQMLNKLQYEIRKITRNNDRFSKELLQLELSRIAFLFGKELNQEILKRFQNNIFTVIQQNLEQTENPLIKQLYYQLQIKIIRMQNQQGDLQYKKQLLSNIFKAYNFSAQEANKNITLQQMVVNNVNYFIKNISNTKQIRQENQKQLQQQPLPQLQSAAATQNQQQQLVMQFKIDQQGQQGNQANQMQNNQAIPPLNINHQSYQELKANYEIVREFLDMDKDKIIFNAIIQQNEFFYDIREIIAGDIFKEIKEQYLIYKEKAKNEREKIKKFQQTLDDENGSIMNLWDQQNDQKNYERSIYLLNLINTYVCWKFREIKEGSKNKENPNAQRTEIDKIQERKFSKRSIHLLVHFIFDSIEERLESYQVLLKKCLILWNNSKIDYKMIKYKYIFNMLKMDNEFILNMQKNTYTKNHVTKYCYFVLNILNICLECSSYTETNYNDQIKQFLKILNWSTTYVLNKQKSRNKNPSISAPANTNPQQNPQQSANNNIPNNQISLTPQGSNQNQNSITLDGAGQGQKNMMQKNMMFNNQIKKQEKAIIKERKECYSLMNSSELEPYMVIMVANILYQLLSVYEEDPHDKQIKESKANLINQIKINIENHHFQIDGQEMQSQEIQPPMSVELIVKLIIYQANLNIDDLYVIRLNQILMILENQNKKHKTKENDKIQYDKLFYENFFCQKYANYIPHNSCFYFETSKLSAQNLLSKFYEEKIEIEQQQQGIDDFLQQEVTQQLQNRKNRYIQLLKREAGFETMQWEIDQHLKYSMSLKDHQEFFEFPFIRQFNSNLSHFQKYSQAQNLLGLMYISLCLLPATKEKNQDSLLQNVKRILKVLFNVVDEGIHYQLRIEALNLLRVFFFGKSNFPNNEIPQRYSKIVQIIDLLPFKSRDEIIKWVFVYQDIEKKYRKFPKSYYYSSPDEIMYSSTTRIAEDNIQFYFFKFLVDILKLTESSLKSISPVELRKYLIIFSKVQSSNNLDYLFDTIEQTENMNELNSMLLILGQAKYEEKLFEKTGSREFTEELQTHLQKDEGEISYYENDDVYLFAYKYLLYKMKRMSTNVKLVFKNFFKITKMTITESANQAKKTTKNQLYEDVQDLLEEIHEFDQKSQLEWILECVQDMSQSCSRKTTIANDFKQIDQIEEFRYIVLAQQNVSKFTPLNIQLIQPSFMQLIKFLIESSQTRAMRVLLYQSIEEYLLFFQSQQYNTYGNRAYSIPGFQQNEDRRISKNWAYALFNVFFFEFSQKNPYVLNANRVYQIIKIHHCWDIGLVYLEKVVEMMNENLLEADIQVYEKIQQIYQDLGETDYMYGTMNQLIRNDNLRKALCLVQQREFLQAQKALIENIDKLNENDQSRCDLYSSHTQDYETLYFISTYRQLFIETQKNLNEWDTLLNLSKVEQNDHLLSESSYFSLNKNIKELSRVLDKDLQILRETKERQCEYQNFYFQPSFMYHHVNILQQFSKGVQFLQIEQSLQKAGIQLAYEWSALPKTITKMHHNLITQFQIITELEEAHRVYGKFKSSEQKYFNSSIDTFHFMNQQWRERMPHKYESLLNWKMLVNQREYMQNTFFEIIKQIIDKNMQQQPNPNLLKQYKENILMQHMDLDYNNYQYFKILQNYGITNINLLPPRRNEIAPIEDNYLRLKCLMKNWLIDSSSTTEENIQEIKKIFNENIQKYLQSENQKQMNQKNTKQYFESMQEIKHYFEQMHEQINLKFSQTLFKKKNYFETIQNVKMLLNRPYNLQKICYTYLEICLRILKSVRSHTDYFNKMIITLIGEALKYKPYYSRMYFILFCQPEFIGQNLDSLAQTAYPRSFSNSLILWLPKILYMYQKFKDQGNNYSQVYLKLLEQLRQQYDQYLFLTLRSYLPQKQEKQERNSLQQIYMQMREILSSRKIESLFKTLQSPLIEDPQQIFLTLEMRYQELDQILELIQNYPSQQVYEEMLVQQLIPQLENSAQNLNKIIPEFVKIQSVNQFINPKSPPSIVMDFIRTKLYAGIIQYFNKYKHLFNLEYSIKNLLQFQLDAQDIEIPGQYVIKNPRIFREFTPKNHIFMSSLNKEVELYPSYRKFVKRIFINATNCKQYAYEFDYDYYNEYKNGNQYTRCSEEVNAHIQLQIGILQQCLNSQFFKSRETYTRNLKLSYPVKLPLNCSSKSQILSLKASSRTLYSMQTVHDWYLTQYCSKNGSQYIDNFNTHLDKFDFTNANIINQSMRDLIKGNALCQFILSKCNTYQEYIDFRQEFTYNYAAASFCNYILGQTVNLQDIYFDYNTGEVFINTNNLEIRNIKDQGNQVIYKNHNSIRISNSIAKFIGQIGISGIMCSSFIAMAKSITTKEYPFLDAMESIIQDLLALNDIKDVRLIFEKIIQKILWIYSQEYQTNNFSKNEICTRVYTIFDTIQENQLNVYNPVSHKYWF
ncbi:hypothetical protein ABPG74_003759 [Tetrahymena malaccensis]